MRYCLQLARSRQGFTSPNPMVGAALVYKDKIIGAGFHHAAGQPHAEVLAFAQVKPTDRHLIRESTLYVTLEPCSHHGRTPPCADLIIQQRPQRVVVAMEDPFEQVRGRGIARIKDAGIAVDVGILEQEARHLNRCFITAHTQKRPFVTLKWAQSADGFIDTLRTTCQEEPVRFSSPLRQMHVHRLRAYHDAILVGNGTALLDNPSLTNRLWWGRQPVRILCAGKRNLPASLHLLDDHVPTYIALLVGASCVSVEGKVQTSLLPLHSPDDPLLELLTNLYQKQILSLLVEGGACLLQQFIDAGLYDAVEIEQSPLILRHGVPAPKL